MDFVTFPQFAFSRDDLRATLLSRVCRVSLLPLPNDADRKILPPGLAPGMGRIREVLSQAKPEAKQVQGHKAGLRFLWEEDCNAILEFLGRTRFFVPCYRVPGALFICFLGTVQTYPGG